jgi:CO/xanthine dehydrogenase FAD-binding subunit
VQTRTRGTLGGNLANASPAADTIPPLFCLDATIILAAQASSRQEAVGEFFTGPGKTCLRTNELIHSVRFEALSGRYGFVYTRLGRRNGMAIAVVSLAVLLELESSGKIYKIRIALGSVAPTVVRGPHVEDMLIDREPSQDLFSRAAAAIQQDIYPISDLRATTDYRRPAARVLLERALHDAWHQAERRQP